MNEYQEVSHSVEVPKNTGIEGFLHTIREILKLGNVQELVVDARGRVSYRRYVLGGDDAPVGVDYEGLQPSAIIRQGHLTEVLNDGSPPHVLISRMYDQVATERLVAVCWAVGAMSIFYRWYSLSGVEVLNKDRLYGTPVLADRGISDTALVLCAAYSKGSATVDCHRFLKLEMEVPRVGPATTVDVI